jgi:hypothetical protein
VGRTASVRLHAELLMLRISLPVLRRALSLEGAVRLVASEKQSVRDPSFERLAVRAASRLWRGSDGPCLERSLALHRVLARAGAGPTLVCGIAPGDERLVGHAWVEVDGAVVVDRDDPRKSYAIVSSYSADGRRLERDVRP